MEKEGKWYCFYVTNEISQEHILNVFEINLAKERLPIIKLEPKILRKLFLKKNKIKVQINE